MNLVLISLHLDNNLEKKKKYSILYHEINFITYNSPAFSDLI